MTGRASDDASTVQDTVDAVEFEESEWDEVEGLPRLVRLRDGRPALIAPRGHLAGDLVVALRVVLDRHGDVALGYFDNGLIRFAGLQMLAAAGGPAGPFGNVIRDPGTACYECSGPKKVHHYKPRDVAGSGTVICPHDNTVVSRVPTCTDPDHA